MSQLSLKKTNPWYQKLYLNSNLNGRHWFSRMNNVALSGEDTLGEDEDAADEGVIGGWQTDLNVRLKWSNRKDVFEKNGWLKASCDKDTYIIVLCKQYNRNIDQKLVIWGKDVNIEYGNIELRKR